MIYVSLLHVYPINIVLLGLLKFKLIHFYFGKKLRKGHQITENFSTPLE